MQGFCVRYVCIFMCTSCECMLEVNAHPAHAVRTVSACSLVGVLLLMPEIFQNCTLSDFFWGGHFMNFSHSLLKQTTDSCWSLNKTLNERKILWDTGFHASSLCFAKLFN